MTHYNPFLAASSAALGHLTSDNAKAYYASRALEDIDRVITVCTAIYSVCHFVYSLGALAGEAHYSAVTTVTEAPVKALPPAPAPIGYLPPAKLALPEGGDRVLPSSGKVHYLPAILPSGDSPIVTVPSLSKLSRNDLRKVCKLRGVKYQATHGKKELLRLLMA